METFKTLSNGDKVKDLEDGMVMEYVVFEGIEYLASKKSMWAAYQFNPENFEVYTGELEAGDIERIRSRRYRAN